MVSLDHWPLCIQPFHCVLQLRLSLHHISQVFYYIFCWSPDYTGCTLQSSLQNVRPYYLTVFVNY